jgi:predicted dehydrogenase
MGMEHGNPSRSGGASGPLKSVAIAGAWGYIGRKVLDAAWQRGLRTHVYDPGPPPADLQAETVARISDESAFYRLDADLFHLALHPEARETGLKSLLQRGRSEPLWILNEKPMVSPESPEDAPAIIESVDRSRAVMLYDFPELFDPLTHRIVSHLSCLSEVELHSMVMERSKDREDPGIARNYKRMLPIQFQESVHCLAYLLHLLAFLRGGLEALLPEGVLVHAASVPYCPPNAELYPYIVDGRCDYRLTVGGLTVDGLTNFKRGAPWTKRRVIRGRAGGEPFVIEAEYLEGSKYLRINGVDQGWDANSSSYEAILSTLDHWRAEIPASTLLRGVYPNPRLARLAYQLSGALWKSSHEQRPIKLADLAALKEFDSGFRRARPTLPRYAGAEA